MKRHLVAFALGLLMGMGLMLWAVGDVQAGRHNCTPSWKCNPPTPSLAIPTPSATALAPGIPPIPAGRGQALRKDFADGSLAPFRILTYPNDHPGDLMAQFCDYGAAGVSVHDGYLELKASRAAGGRWSCSFVGTGLDGRGNAASFSFQYGTARVMARLNGGRGAWQTAWYLASSCWCAAEIDWPEQIGGQLGGYLHGTNADGRVVSTQLPAGWHEYGVTKAPGYVAFLYDGAEIGRANLAMGAPVALLADAKVGLTAPDATTPSPLFLHIAWWTVDPVGLP